MADLSRQMAKNKLKNLGYGLPDEILNQFSEVLSQIFILHAYGDEVMTDSLKLSVRNLSKAMDSPMEIDEDIELDFYPADNNVKIVF